MPFKQGSFFLIAITSFLFTLHLSGSSYINSTFAGTFFNESNVGILFSVAALVAIILLIMGVPHFIRRFGSSLLIWILLLVNILTLYAFTLPLPPEILIPSFIVYIATNTLIIFGLDITFEHITPIDKVGSWRGAYYMIINIAWVIGAPLAGYLISKGGFHGLYKSLLILVTIVFIIFASRVTKYNVHTSTFLRPIVAIKRIVKSRNISGIFITNFMLQFFFAIMVIFTPIFLHENIGFSWEQIGLMFLIMLLPFVFIQYPLGSISDHKIGEKELLIAGIIGMGLATLFLPSITQADFVVWSLVLFATRVGAATVEVMSDVYFFKHVAGDDDVLLGFYRSLNPLAYVIAPLLGGVIFFQFGFQTLCYTLGVLILISVLFAFRIKDVHNN